jgi:hypothetical protein
MDKFIVDDWFPIQKINDFQDLEDLEKEWINVPNIIEKDPEPIIDKDWVSIPISNVTMTPRNIVEKKTVTFSNLECKIIPEKIVSQTCENWEIMNNTNNISILEYVKISLLFSSGILFLIYPYIINWLIIRTVGIFIIIISGYLIFVSFQIPSCDDDESHKIIKSHVIEATKEIVIKKIKSKCLFKKA